MDELAGYLTPDEAAEELRRTCAARGITEIARVRNLEFIAAPRELYPLAPRVTPPLAHITAFLVDMDGTSTTTEPLALHALEYMVRRITGREDATLWAGLDPRLDVPHVIGSSNFRHTEFLVQRYRQHIVGAAFAQAFIEAVCWTLAHMTDTQRRLTVLRNARQCGLMALLQDAEFQRLIESGAVRASDVGRLVSPLVERHAATFDPPSDSAQVAAALDVYYMCYHALLRELEHGQGAALAGELLGDEERALVAPMPGYAVFVPLVKGWLGGEAEALFPLVAEHGEHEDDPDKLRQRLAALGGHFARQPAKLALVTASIAYETHACMAEVLRVMRAEVAEWPVADEIRTRVTAGLGDVHTVFDAVVCASDVWEGRLKPHRDLYSLALHQMGIPPEQYAACVGLEDTEPGIIALRAAGVGCAVALPNRDTSGQNYAAAVEVIHGGLPELILERNLLLRAPPNNPA